MTKEEHEAETSELKEELKDTYNTIDELKADIAELRDSHEGESTELKEEHEIIVDDLEGKLEKIKDGLTKAYFEFCP